MNRKRGLATCSAPSRPGRMLNTPIHPELVKRVKVAAIERDTTIAQILHEILCQHFDRTDLADEVPEAARLAAAASA